jgi:hypothetical protein
VNAEGELSSARSSAARRGEKMFHDAGEFVIFARDETSAITI